MNPRHLLLSVLGEETDCEVVDYVIGSIEGTDEESIDELVELLTAHSMTDPSEESVRAIATQVAAMVTAQPAAVAAAPLEPAAPPLAAPEQPTSRAVATARPPGLPQQPRLPQQPDARVDGSGGDRLSPAAAPAPDGSEAAIAALRELVPEASPSVCRLLLQRSGGSLDEAAGVLFSTDVLELEAAAAAEEARSAADKELERKAGNVARRRTVNRYSVEAVSEGPLELQPPRLPYSGTRKEALRGDAIRYRDGQVSSTKGGKFIIEEKPEWDGGSKGKVNNKGKRGTGFH